MDKWTLGCVTASSAKNRVSFSLQMDFPQNVFQGNLKEVFFLNNYNISSPLHGSVAHKHFFSHHACLMWNMSSFAGTGHVWTMCSTRTLTASHSSSKSWVCLSKVLNPELFCNYKFLKVLRTLSFPSMSQLLQCLKKTATCPLMADYEH